MGRMKDIAIDIQDLHLAAVSADDEESFMTHVMDTGWVSPSEKEARAYQASRMIAGLTDGERIAVQRVLDAVGISISTIDFPIKTLASAHN